MKEYILRKSELQKLTKEEIDSSSSAIIIFLKNCISVLNCIKNLPWKILGTSGFTDKFCKNIQG